MRAELPPGPRLPATLQTIGNWTRPASFLLRQRERYGTPFTIRLLGSPPFVMISDPEAIKQIFTAPPEVLHPGEGARVLEPLLGRHSVILLDEAPHLEQRRLLLPAFHGDRMERLAGLMAELAEREVASWPVGEPVELHERLQRLTLEIILRAVFGIERGARLESLRERLTQLLRFGESPLSLLGPPPRPLRRVGPVSQLYRRMEEVDEMILALIEERRAAGGEGDDVLAMLLAATHEDGAPMSSQELRDELMTALVAGHETTASQLAWGFERLVRDQAVMRHLQSELATEDEVYLNATINEILRLRPVLPNAEPRKVMEPVEIGGFAYPRGVSLLASIYLLHHDPEIYPEPSAFRPERFLGQAPGTYTWIPFGGGRRRCLGASFALLEMRIAIRAVLGRFELAAAEDGAERTNRRGITFSPSGGARVVLSMRSAAPAGGDAGEAQALAVA
jgi:cytochrome P450